jgi:adenylate cyclase
MSAYEIRFETSPRRVRVEFNGTWIADSRRALILHETRQPAAYYFPRADVKLDLFQKTAQVTHCPFKGNASYWSVSAGGTVAENAAWSYDEPYDDAKPIREYLSFYPNRVSAIYDGDDEIPHLARDTATLHANSIAGWLLGEAWKAQTPDALMDGFCRCLKAAGVPIARMTVIVPTLHPQVFATVFVWREDTGVRTIYEPHDILHQPKFKDSPFAQIMRGAGGVRRRIEQPDVKLDFPVVRDLHAEGATDYVAMPFHFADGQLNVMSMTSFTGGGFSTSDLGRIYEVLPVLSRLFEVHAQRRTAVTLLQTFLGRHTGTRVLDGLVKHGDGEHIDSVVWFSDLRESTALSISMERGAYLDYLNRYFHCMAGSILESGGEVLRFIGDAALAIFPISSNWAGATGAAEACRRAIAAARLAAERIAADNAAHPARAPIRYGIGLHLGQVTYGNIGVPERLEFTVIGSAANTAARVESMTKTLGRNIVISSSFADSYAGKVESLGKHMLKDVEGEQELFTLA